MAAVAGRQTPALALTGVKKPGPGPHADAPDVTSGARRYTAAMKWQRHEDGTMLLAVVIICALAGQAGPGLAVPVVAVPDSGPGL